METKLASPRFLILAAIGLGILGGLIPILLALAALGGARSLRPVEAISLLESESTTLVDVRPAAAFAESHVQGALSLPLDKVLSLQNSMDLPAALQGKTLVVICDAGFASARAARRLEALGVEVYHVRGGLQEWGRDGPRLDRAGASTAPQAAQSSFALIVDAAGRASLPYDALSQIEQAAAASGLMLIKPTYMLLSLLLVFAMLGGTALDVRLAGWGILFFLLGEVACAIHFTLLKDDSYLAEYLHSYGMVLAFGLVAYALFEGLDHRVLHFSSLEKRCAMVELCKSCVKTTAKELSPTHCGLRRLALLLLPMGALLALIPLTAPLSLSAYNTNIGPIIHYNIRTIIQQLFETRYSPLAAVILFGLAWIMLVTSRRTLLHPLVRLLASGAFGFLAFSYFRTGLGLIYADNPAIALFWEEATELMFILTSLYVLWVFKHTLLPESLLTANAAKI